MPTQDVGRRTQDAGRGTKDSGQGTEDERLGTRDWFIPKDSSQGDIDLRVSEMKPCRERARGDARWPPRMDSAIPPRTSAQRETGAGSSAGRCKARPMARAQLSFVTGSGAVALIGPLTSGVSTIQRTISIQSRR